MRILISPYSSRLRNGEINAKNFPYWSELVALLTRAGIPVVQIGISGEARIDGVGAFYMDGELYHLKEIVRDFDTWISVDNFFPHFCHAEGLQPGTVIWGPSDYRIFGYPENSNVHLGERYLKPYQYESWECTPFDASVFPSAEAVYQSMMALV